MSEQKDEFDTAAEERVQVKNLDMGMSRFLYSNGWVDIMAGMER